ncbi:MULTISPECIES: DUF4190 domain-containing protein [Arthrobacter]|uniref:DUF4190 domain-containing protein n=1 Tax=Arthrobacter terricola TaxID=2547396 RepID=A0A4R5KC73_9MICC|nr:MULTISPECIES: DUF4190 domain-containing protein [Arthrobacter]MBT8162562.1 DUF4190 domain-containing protein [Arthrobacter sp. GN70]TDF92879.1 DUF4190 domain-containing protein [Arthrobacter terricola]
MSSTNVVIQSPIAGVRTKMAAVNTTVLATISLSGVVFCAIVAWLTSNAMFALVGGGVSLIALLLIAALVPAEQATKPAGASMTNTLAVVALVAACVSGLALAAIVLGHVARNQIGRDGGRGDKLALGALVVGYSEVVASVLVVLWTVTFIRFH